MKKLPDKALILFFIIAACVSLAVYIGYIKGIPTLYTHLFYIPILLTGIWYGKKAIYIGFFFGAVHILVTHFSPLPVSVNELGRAGAFILVAYVTGIISEARAREENKILIEKNFSANIIATIPNSLLVLDRDLRIKSVNRTFCEIFKTDIEKVTGSSIADVLQDKDGTLVMELTRIIGTGELLENLEIHYRPEMPDELIFNINAKEIVSEDEVLVVIEDITARKRAEVELRKTRDYLDKLIKCANAPIIVWDPEFRITRFNQAFEHLTGYASGEVTGRHPGMLFPEDSRDESLSKIESTSNGEYWESVEIPILRKNGDVYTVLWNSANIYAEDGSTLLATIAQGQDITGRKRGEEDLKKSNQQLKDTQAQLFQAGKLAAMGEMATGVVHELTQPLLGIKGFTAAIHEDTKALFENETDFNIKIVNQIQSDLDVIQRQTERMAKILNSVSNFARVSTTEKIPLDINQPIEDALLLFSEQLRVHNIAIEKNLAPDLPEVMGNASQLEQVFINLITNARAAMDAKSGRGQLTITTGESANGIYIEVEDTGIGADAKTVSRMFEPFFTTRIMDEGTGLGLSIVQRIINDHNGTIDAKCQPGGGCKFIIHLPAGVKEGNKNEKHNE